MSVTCGALFQLVFRLIFTQKNWFRLLESHKASTDDRTLGGMFYELFDEMNELDWAVALTQLMAILQDALTKTKKAIKNLVTRQLQQWISHLPHYIKAYLLNLSCES